MGIARSSFYAEPVPASDDTALVEAMHAIKDEFEAYGWRRMQAALRQRGWLVNHKKVKRLMRENGLQPTLRRRFVATTDSNHDAPIFPDRTRELAVVDGPNRLWVVDLTYVAIAVGFVYVALIMDAWSRRVVWLRHRPPDRRPPDLGRPGCRDRRAPSAARLHPPFGSRRPRRTQPVVATPW